jgi:hypothetical protein
MKWTMVVRRPFWICLLALLAASGCGPQLPEYSDPLAEISKARGVSVPEDIAVKAGAAVAMTLGANVDRFLKYHDDGKAYAASVGASKKVLDESDPQYLLSGAVSILKRRYPKLRDFDDLASAGRARMSTTFVIDIQTKAGMYPGDYTTVDLVVIAFNDQQKPISRLSARGATAIRPYEPPRIREAHDQALAELSKKADRLLN